ncbi:MAG: flagellar protein FlaG [Bryobacteraceae bacterium]
MEIPELSRLNRIASVSPVLPETNFVAQHRDVVKAVQALNKAEMFGAGYELSFSLDSKTQEAVVQIVDKKSRQVIAQVMPPHILEAAQQLRLNEMPDFTDLA